MTILVGLILIPLVVALLLLVVRNDTLQAIVVIAGVGLLAVCTLVLTAQYLFSPSGFVVPQVELLNYLAMAIDLVCCAYIIYRAVRASQYLVTFMAGIQAVLVLVYDLVLPSHTAVSADLYVDQFTIIMALIIALIGGSICIYALGYMRDYQKHKEHEGSQLAQSGDPTHKAAALLLTRDRRPGFFAICFVFLAAMFALVFSNRLSWFFTAWEVTTLCSFVLIGFTRSDEAIRNAFRAVAINLAGGLALISAFLLVAGGEHGITELDQLVAVATEGSLTLPVMLIVFAGMTKAAQMPFQNWLLGAMVAPTPVSALLHSSTMVKAGVFIIIKLSPALGWNIAGLFALIVGGLTFLCCSALAISQSNSKRVLAYSTVANLGLIICCAGVGTPEAAWAAIFLLIFHAAAKALLFCCVGTAEHHLGSRDIEHMDNIFVRMPWIALCMALGMMAMFVAPFGMLVSKWAALVSITASGHLELIFVLAFGSALTFVFWAKWLGKVLAVGSHEKPVASKISRTEGASLGIMALGLIAITLALPYLSDYLVMPYLHHVGDTLLVSSWMQASSVLGYVNLLIMNIVLMAMLLVLVIQILRPRPPASDTVYLAGVATDFEKRSFGNSFEQTNTATQRNWYMEQVFGEKVLGRQASILLTAVMILFFILGSLAEMMIL